MAYSRTNWKNSTAPYLNATNLNKIEKGIYDNSILPDANTKLIEENTRDIEENARDIADNTEQIDINAGNILGLSVGEEYQGTWTPEAGTEYPASPEGGWSYYIQFLDDDGYEFVGGDLAGRIANNGDKIIFNGTTWSMIDNTNDSLGYYLVDDISSMLSLSPLQGSLCHVYGYHVANDGGGGIFNYDPALSGTNNGGTILDGWVRQFGGDVNVRWFGAKGDGATDDTASIQAALDTTYTGIEIPEGVYIITDPLQDGTPSLTTNVDDRRIYGDGTITTNTVVSNAIENTGNQVELSLRVDGNNLMEMAIVSNGDEAWIHGCFIQNLYSTSKEVRGISINGAEKCIVKNNIILNLESVDTYSRGIHWANTQNLTTYSLIEDNAISNVIGNEGDSIVVLNSTGAGVYLDAKITIKGNIINTFSRRAIKVQANYVKTLNNSISNYTTGWANPNTVIDLVQGSDHVVMYNLIDACVDFNGIATYAEVGESFDNFVVSSNTIINREGCQEIGISIITRGNNITISSNKIEFGTDRAIAVSGLDKILIQDNSITGDETSSNVVMSIGSAMTRVIVSGNSFIGGTRLVFIDTQSRAVVADNTVISDTPMFRDQVGNTNSYVSRNILQGNSAFYNDADSRYNKFGGNASLDGGSMLYSEPLFSGSTAIPPVFLGSSYVPQGQILYKANPSAGTNIGWVSMSAGAADIVEWKEFGTIEA